MPIVNNWMDGLQKCEVVFILAVDDYFDYAEAFLVKHFGQKKGTPFRIAQHDGCEIPDGFYDGIEDIKIRKFTDKHELAKIIDEYQREDA